MKKIFFLVFSLILLSVKGITAQTLSKKDTSNVHFLNSRKFFIYKVEKGETLFGISQKFKIPQEEILDFNHEAKKGLKVKMKLWIPAYSWLKKDSLDKIAENIPPVKEKSEFTIAVVTTLNLPKVYTQEDTSATFLEEPIGDLIEQNLEFTEGIIRSAERLKSPATKIRLIIIDSEGDSLKTILKVRKKNGIDVIVTNESNSILRGLSYYSESRNVRLISCALSSAEIVRDNKNAICLLPSSTKQCEMMGKFAGDFFKNSTLILVRTSSSKENERSDFLKTGWLQSKQTKIKKFEYVQSGKGSFIDSLEKSANNVIFIPSSNEDMVSSLLNSLKEKVNDYKVTVIGLPTWQYFESIDPRLIQSGNVHVFNSGFIDYKKNEVNEFRKYFREKYYSEPSESAYQGYDVLTVSVKLLLSNEKIVSSENIHFPLKGIYSDYYFVTMNPGNAVENCKIHVFKPSGDVSTDLSSDFQFK